MGWTGIAVGSMIGSLFGGPFGGLLGAFAGHHIEKYLNKNGSKAPGVSADRARVFCGSTAAMLAKMAKADGRISQYEIAEVERAFRRLGFSPAAREYAIGVFRRAKDDPKTIYQYAGEFTDAIGSVEVRELFYEILWDVACSDGNVSPGELQILQLMPQFLRIRSDWFGYFAAQRLHRRPAASTSDPVRDAYVVLGASASDSPSALKAKYRELAKKNHPDVLRAQGLPEDMIGKATERMSRINEAWKILREARGI